MIEPAILSGRETALREHASAHTFSEKIVDLLLASFDHKRERLDSKFVAYDRRMFDYLSHLFGETVEFSARSHYQRVGKAEILKIAPLPARLIFVETDDPFSRQQSQHLDQKVGIAPRYPQKSSEIALRNIKIAPASFEDSLDSDSDRV